MESLTKWLLTTKVFAWAYRQGGIDSVGVAHRDIMETLEEAIDRKAQALADQKLGTLLSVVDVNQIVAQKGRTLYIGGKMAEEGTLHNLKQEAEYLEASELWKLLNETPKELAQRAMFVDDGTIENQLIKGRAVLYTLATQKKILDLFKSYPQAN